MIFNRVASERHRALLAGAVMRHLPGLAILGALPADPALALPSRHLGLIPAGEIGEAEGVIERAAEQVGASLDIDRLLALARPSTLSGEAVNPGIPPLGRRIAVARDDAFCFIYPALLDGWRRHGADLAFFSPLADEAPDPAADAVYLPGGYPELWAGRIAAADVFLAGLRRAAAGRKPIYGECGGYMVLGEALIDADGHSHPMAGLLPVVSSFAERRLSLGYRCATLARRRTARPHWFGLSRPRIPLCDNCPTGKRRPAMVNHRRRRNRSRHVRVAARLGIRLLPPSDRSVGSTRDRRP